MSITITGKTKLSGRMNTGTMSPLGPGDFAIAPLVYFAASTPI